MLSVPSRSSRSPNFSCERSPGLYHQRSRISMDPPDPPSKSDWDAEMAAGGKPLVILKKHTAAANSMLKAYKDVKMAHIEAIAPTATAPNEVEKQTMSLGQHDCTDRTTGDENLEANEVVAPSGRRFFRAKRTDWAKGDETEERSGAENVAG